jgi:hypothetical protein
VSENPYGSYVTNVDLFASLEETPQRIAVLVEGWSTEDFERTYEPGKWTARQLLIHLAQIEVVFGERIRFALNKPDFVVIPFDQDEWMALDEGVDARAAFDAYQGMRRMNLAFFRSLTPAQRTHQFPHPERGTIDVDWIITALAGHERHHLPQFETIAAAR